jgi:hypothetical protein
MTPPKVINSKITDFYDSEVDEILDKAFKTMTIITINVAGDSHL